AAGARDTEALEHAIATLAAAPNGGLIVMPDEFNFIHTRRIAELAERHRVPAIYPFPFSTARGGLLAYSTDYNEQYRRGATYVDRILRGASPADLPIEQPHKFKCPGPFSLNRPHPPHSRAHRDFTVWLIRDAFAVRERLGDPRVVPSFRCTFFPGMPSPATPGNPNTVSSRQRCRHGLRRESTGSALPMIPQSVSRGRCISGLLSSHIRYGLPGCSPPCTDQTDIQPPGAFTSRLSTGRSPFPLLDMTTTATGPPLLAGLSPARMTASFAALIRSPRQPERAL